MYLSKQSDDHRPKTLISHGGKLAEAAVVAAPIRKLWPANSLEFSPPFESKSLVSLVHFFRVRNEPDSLENRGPVVGKGVLDSKYANMAEIGHKLEFVLPIITIVCPCLKGPVWETFNRTNIYLGEDWHKH